MAGEITVTLHLLGGSSAELRLLPGESILDARTQAAEALGRRPRLVFGGKVLEDSESVEAAGLRDGSELTAVLSDGPTAVLTASRDGQLRLFDVETGSLMGTFADLPHGICSATLSPDGQLLLACGVDGTARVIDVGTAECITTFEGYAGGEAYSGSFSPDCSKVVVPCTAFGRGRMHSGVAKVFDVKTGFHVVTLMAGDVGRDPGVVYSATFSPDGSQVLLAADGALAQLLHVGSGSVEMTFRGHAGDVHSAVFSPDGRQVLTASDDGTSMLFDVGSGRRLATFQVGNSASSAAFSPNGEKVLVAGMSGASLFDVASKKCEAKFDRHRTGVTSACFSPGGSKVLTAGDDAAARLWSVEGGQCEKEFAEHGGVVTAAMFSLDYADGTHW